MRIGNERLMRINGLPVIYRQAIQDQVQERIGQASQEEVLALYALAGYYETRVYTPKKIQNAQAYEEKHQGFASAIAEELKKDFQNRLRRMGVAETALAQAEKNLPAALPQWAQVIEYSDEDAYPWEVQQPEVEEGEAPRLKYRLGHVAQVQTLLQPNAGVGMGAAPAPAFSAPLPAVPAPAPPAPLPVQAGLPPMPGWPPCRLRPATSTTWGCKAKPMDPLASTNCAKCWQKAASPPPPSLGAKAGPAGSVCSKAQSCNPCWATPPPRGCPPCRPCHRCLN